MVIEATLRPGADVSPSAEVMIIENGEVSNPLAGFSIEELLPNLRLEEASSKIIVLSKTLNCSKGKIMTKQELYNEVKAEFATMTLPAPYIPISIANNKIAAYNAYKTWLENNNPGLGQNSATSTDSDHFMELYNSPY